MRTEEEPIGKRRGKKRRAFETSEVVEERKVLKKNKGLGKRFGKGDLRQQSKDALKGQEPERPLRCAGEWAGNNRYFGKGKFAGPMREEPGVVSAGLWCSAFKKRQISRFDGKALERNHKGRRGVEIVNDAKERRK